MGLPLAPEPQSSKPLKDADFMAYGWRWRSAIHLDLFHRATFDRRSPDIQVFYESGANPPERQVLSGNGRSHFLPDGFRFRDHDFATMDSFGARVVRVYPGSGWNGHLPGSFYSTFTGALMAWRGGLPIHGSAVEIDGKAVVICGEQGAGKSSTAAALITRGARLISDDLTVLRPASLGQPAVVYAGRRCIRLFPDTAAALKDQAQTETIASSGSKELVVPACVDADSPIPLGGFVLLGVLQESFTSEDIETRMDRLWYRVDLFKSVYGYAFRRLVLQSIMETAQFTFCPRFASMRGMSLNDVADVVHHGWRKAI